MMEHLLPPAMQENTLKGCELIFPDTAFFVGGKAKIVVKMDKDHCLQGVKKVQKLQKDEIYKDFSTVVRERKKDVLGIFYDKYGECFKKQAQGSIKDLVMANMATFMNTDPQAGRDRSNTSKSHKKKKSTDSNTGMKTQ